MKKALLFGLPLVLLALGSTVGLAYVGIIKVPFLPFKKKGPKPPEDDGKGGPFAPFLAAAERLGRGVGAAPATKGASAPPAPPRDPEPGEKKLASLWAEMPPDRLVALVEKWPEPQLGRILARMDEEAVTTLLATLPPRRAASLSRAVAAATDERAEKVRANAEK